jgi:L-asparaginase
MQAPRTTTPTTVWVLGTGGTISGLSSDPEDTLGYTAGQVDVGALVGQATTPEHLAVRCEQLAQVDSKDMTWAIWLSLAQRVQALLTDADTVGVVITHGTDTMEETAIFLHEVLGEAVASKPVVLTGAMLPASAPQPDGPRNIADALVIAGAAGAHGVVITMAGGVWDATQGQKLHSGRLNAFGARDEQALGSVENGVLRLQSPWPRAAGPAVVLASDTAAPWVEIVVSAAQANSRAVHALVQAGVQGLVVATTGNGTVHETLQQALEGAQEQGVRVVRASRTAHGHIHDGHPNPIPHAGALSPFKARVVLMVELAKCVQRPSVHA